MKKFFFLCLLLLIPSLAEAVTVVNRYVDTDCANNGDGTSTSCAASNGAAGAYKTVSQAFSDVSSDYANFVTSDVQVTVHCKGATADTTQLNLTGVTLDATRYIKFVVDQADRHDGKWNTGKYRLSVDDYWGALRIDVPFVRISGFQIEQTRTGASGGTEGSGIYMNLDSGDNDGFVLIESSIIRYSGDYTNQNAYGCSDPMNGRTNFTTVLRNNIFIGFVRGIECGRTSTNDDVYVYNNTIYSNQSGAIGVVVRGYGGAGATLNFYNNLYNGSQTGWDIDVSGGATWNHSNNLSEDTTSPDNTYDSLAVSFVNEGSGDFHLSSGDTAAKDAGADESGATNGMSDDIDGQTRSGTWDIGADEYQSAGGSAVATILRLKGRQ